MSSASTEKNLVFIYFNEYIFAKVGERICDFLLDFTVLRNEPATPLNSVIRTYYHSILQSFIVKQGIKTVFKFV